MKLIPLLLVLGACVDFEPGEALNGATVIAPDAALIEPDAALANPDAAIDAAPAPCVESCYRVIGFNAYFATARADGQSWDADGSLPEPLLGVQLRGATLGETTPRFAPFLHYPPPTDMYRVTWNEPLGVTALSAGDKIEVYVVDAEERYTLTRCSITLTTLYLTNGNVACAEITQIEIHFEEVLP